MKTGVSCKGFHKIRSPNYHLWSSAESEAELEDDVFFFQECKDSRIDSGSEIARSFTKKQCLSLSLCVTGVCQYGNGGDDKTIKPLRH